MTDTDTVKRLHNAIENGDTDKVRSLLTDDFVFDHGADEGTLDKGEFLVATAALQRAIPDLAFNLQDLEGEGTVTGVARATGTNTGPFDLSVMGGPEVPPTNKHVEGPREPARWVVRDGKVAAHSVKAVDGGGISGILRALGIESEIRR